MTTSTTTDHAKAWREAFKAHWIWLSEGRAAGANFEELVSRIYAADPEINPESAARLEWKRPVSPVPDPVAAFTAAAVKHGLIKAGDKLDKNVAEFAFEVFGLVHPSHRAVSAATPR